MTTISECQSDCRTKNHLVPSIGPEVNLAEGQENQEDTSQACQSHLDDVRGAHDTHSLSWNSNLVVFVEVQRQKKKAIGHQSVCWIAKAHVALIGSDLLTYPKWSGLVVDRDE